jgi:hypothetical protein
MCGYGYLGGILNRICSTYNTYRNILTNNEIIDIFCVGLAAGTIVSIFENKNLQLVELKVY